MPSLSYEPLGSGNRRIRNETAYAPSLEIGSFINKFPLCLREVHQDLVAQCLS
jgi:hypothetical protein